MGGGLGFLSVGFLEVGLAGELDLAGAGVKGLPVGFGVSASVIG